MHFLAIRRGSTKPGDPRQAQIVTLRAATHGNDVVVAYLSVAEDAQEKKLTTNASHAWLGHGVGVCSTIVVDVQYCPPEIFTKGWPAGNAELNVRQSNRLKARFGSAFASRQLRCHL